MASNIPKAPPIDEDLIEWLDALYPADVEASEHTLPRVILARAYMRQGQRDLIFRLNEELKKQERHNR